MKYTINVTRIQKHQYSKSMNTFFSPIKSLFQIAQRCRTSKIFTTNVFNSSKILLTSVTLVLKSHDETHSIPSEPINVHLAKEYVRPSSKYIWSIPLVHFNQRGYQNWIKRNVLLILMPRLYCQLVKLVSVCFWFMSDNFFVLYKCILKNRSVISFNKVRELHLYYVYLVTYQNRKINSMEFWPLSPEISCQQQ